MIEIYNLDIEDSLITFEVYVGFNEHASISIQRGHSEVDVEGFGSIESDELLDEDFVYELGEVIDSFVTILSYSTIYIEEEEQ